MSSKRKQKTPKRSPEYCKRLRTSGSGIVPSNFGDAISEKGVLFVDGPSCTGKTSFINAILETKSPHHVVALSTKKLIMSSREDLNKYLSDSVGYLNTITHANLCCNTIFSRSPVSNLIYLVIGRVNDCFDENGELAARRYLEDLFDYYPIDAVVFGTLGALKPLILSYDDLDSHLLRKSVRAQKKDVGTTDMVYLQAEKMVFDFFADRYGWPLARCPSEASEYEKFSNAMVDIYFKNLKEKSDHCDDYASREIIRKIHESNRKCYRLELEDTRSDKILSHMPK